MKTRRSTPYDRRRGDGPGGRRRAAGAARAAPGARGRGRPGAHAPPPALQAVDLAATQAPDLVVLDLWLPDIDGVEVVRRLRGWLDVPILILSGDSDEERKVSALDSGADDFLAEAVRVLRADRPAARAEAAHGPRPGRPAAGVRRPGRRPAAGGGRARRRRCCGSRPTEWQLLEAMVTHPGKLLTHRWLVARVWGGSHGDESRQALRTHIRSLRAKIGDDAGTPRYLRTESGAGYRWLAEPGDGLRRRGTPPGPSYASGAGRPRTGAATLHDLNNVLTALHLALHLAQGKVARLRSATPGESSGGAGPAAT